MARTLIFALILAATVTACSQGPTGPLPDPPTPTTYTELSASIERGDTPTVVNVWASWCLPCRSEAPLVAAGSIAHPDVRFVGLNVRDSASNAQEFIAEFLGGANMIHLSDSSGTIPIDLGATRGVPITFFYARNGELVKTHLGIIDEPTMARYLDEIDR